MHIFITGIAGFLGSNLADFYIEKGIKVSGCDNLIGGDIENVHSDVIFYKGDCENLDFMTQSIKDDVDVVCHCAAYAHEGLSSISPTLITKNNLVGSVAVFTAAIRKNVKRVVFCSSMARYGDIKSPFKESDECNPVDPYGVSKVAAEKILKILSKTHGIEYNIAVPHNIIGRNQKYDDPFRNVASIMTNMILQNKQPIIYGDGNQKRCFSDIRDCIYCLDQLCMNKSINEEILNIGPDEETISINDLCDMISNKLKFNLPPIYVKDRPNEVKHAMCSSQRARERINYVTKYTLEDSIDDLISYIKEKGPKKFKYNYDLEINNDQTPSTWSKKIF